MSRPLIRILKCLYFSLILKMISSLDKNSKLIVIFPLNYKVIFLHSASNHCWDWKINYQYNCHFFLEVIFLFHLDASRVFSLSLFFCTFTMMNPAKLIYLSHFGHTDCVSHGQRSLVGYSPWGCKESDMTEQLTLALMWGQGLLLVPEHRIS